MSRLFISILFFVGAITATAATPVGFIPYNDGVLHIDTVGVLVDQSGTLTIDEALHREFKFQKSNFGSTNNIIWLKINIQNNSNNDSLFLDLRNPNLYRVEFFTVMDNSISNQLVLGRSVHFNNRPYKTSLNLIYPFYIKQGTTTTIYIKLASFTPLFTPLFLSKSQYLAEEVSFNFLKIGVYLGVVFIMFLYHLFILIKINKDEGDLMYIIYILIVGVSQLVLNGFANKYFWPDNSWMAANGYNMVGVASGLATGVYTKIFLRTHILVPTIDKYINIMIVLYLICIPVHFIISPFYAFNFINIFAVFGAAVIIVAAVYVKNKGYRPAKFFLGAFSLFLSSVVIFVLRSMNIVPYNNFTANILEIGSALQITFLSFALADKINIYRQEQEKAVKENERLVKEHNINLEQQVADRTAELSQTNWELKEAQTKLVENEKMAALGQLTAGIAHEINNPINFVAANIKPLDLDIKEVFQVIDKYNSLDLTKELATQLVQIEAFKKDIDIDYLHEEIQTLLNGIKEGAGRTADIVSNLKNFSRIDQSLIKKVNLNEGIESTIVLIRNAFPKDMILIKELGNIPPVECEPGKINQVFMNIISNAVQAINAKIYQPEEKKQLSIKTWAGDGFVFISIKDSGTGMPDAVKERVFEPFFTTKDVGEGTGLGMSIVKSIIDNHQGTIKIVSIEGLGTEFIITLPLQT